MPDQRTTPVLLGLPNWNRARGLYLAELFLAAAQKDASSVAPILREMRATGFKSVRALAAELNRLKVPTPRAGEWHPTTVARVLARIG